MASAPYWLNTAWMLGCAQEAYAFRRAAGNVRRAQEQILLRILRDNRQTWYGRENEFEKIDSIGQYQQRVPLVGYEQLREAIDRVASGESAVLTRDPVTLLEPTGGSSQAEKLIPYNAALKKEFQRAIAAWVFNVMHGLPAARHGRAYWSISPLSLQRRVSGGGIPIGFEDDREYLSAWQRPAVSRLMVIPSAVRHLQSVDNARYVTALHLLASQDLSLISVWSPTYLTALTAGLPNWLDSMCEDLRRGQIRLPNLQRESQPTALSIRPDARRADQLKAIFAKSPETGDAFSECWPRLALISCWGDATSSLYLPKVRAEFPQALVQPKGLLATEGVVSIPLMPASGSVLAVRSHFLEFAEVTGRGGVDGPIRLADELESGRCYRVILTTGGGLYRYDLGDEIEVVGFYDQCPCIRLLGRGGHVSDLVGEKLHERFVRSAVEEVVSQFGLQVRFAMVTPVAGPPPRYRLLLQPDRAGEADDVRHIETRMEQLLRANLHYRIAVDAKQLQPIDVKVLHGDGWKIYEETCVRRGQKMGDIKPVALDAWNGWEEAFQGAALEDQSVVTGL